MAVVSGALTGSTVVAGDVVVVAGGALGVEAAVEVESPAGALELAVWSVEEGGVVVGVGAGSVVGVGAGSVVGVGAELVVGVFASPLVAASLAPAELPSPLEAVDADWVGAAL